MLKPTGYVMSYAGKGSLLLFGQTHAQPLTTTSPDASRVMIFEGIRLLARDSANRKGRSSGPVVVAVPFVCDLINWIL
jgi:hypothetical protein